MPDSNIPGAPPGPASATGVPGTELLYRRLLPGAWYRAQSALIPQKYFMPRPWQSDERPGDTDGISINRASLTDAVTTSRRPDNGEYVPLAEFTASDVYRIGLHVRGAPLLLDPSHALIPELNSLDRRDTEKERKMEEWALALRNCSQLIKPRGT